MNLINGKAKIQVKALIKKVTSESEQVKGKIVCKETCEFLLAVPVKSFISSDSNRDMNMREVTEADKFPLATAKGQFPASVLESANGIIQAQIEFHGVTKPYRISLKDKGQRASFNLDLEAHGIKRPSFLTIKIENEVPVTFELKWDRVAE